MKDCHDTHCCILHLCKYGREDCPVANGIRKQEAYCEHCGLECEGYYGEPERTLHEQMDYLEQLWAQKHNEPVKENFDLYQMSKTELRHEVVRLRELLKKG